jgi:hypothetical protein
MTIERALRSTLPSVVIAQWTLTSGWPGYRVYLDAHAWGFDGDSGDLFIEAETPASAKEIAAMLSKATGWPISISFEGTQA